LSADPGSVPDVLLVPLATQNPDFVTHKLLFQLFRELSVFAPVFWTSCDLGFVLVDRAKMSNSGDMDKRPAGSLTMAELGASLPPTAGGELLC